MIKVDFNNRTRFKLDRKLLVSIIGKTLEKTVPGIVRKNNISVSVAAVGSAEIEKINAKYRGKNKATDILSFSSYKNNELLTAEKSKELFLGELVFCWEYIKKSATINKVPAERELAYVISHGTLHLLGFRHGREMFSIQDDVAGGK